MTCWCGRRSPTHGIGLIASAEGSAAVEFALVAPLVLLIFTAIVQIGMAGYLRATLTAAAADGARAGALSGAAPGVATRRTEAMLADSLAAGVVVRVSENRTRASGLDAMSVTVESRIPLVGLLGPEGMTVTGRSVMDQP